MLNKRSIRCILLDFHSTASFHVDILYQQLLTEAILSNHTLHSMLLSSPLFIFSLSIFPPLSCYILLSPAAHPSLLYFLIVVIDDRWNKSKFHSTCSTNKEYLQVRSLHNLWFILLVPETTAVLPNVEKDKCTN